VTCRHIIVILYNKDIRYKYIFGIIIYIIIVLYYVPSFPALCFASHVSFCILHSVIVNKDDDESMKHIHVPARAVHTQWGTLQSRRRWHTNSAHLAAKTSQIYEWPRSVFVGAAAERGEGVRNENTSPSPTRKRVPV